MYFQQESSLPEGGILSMRDYDAKVEIEEDVLSLGEDRHNLSSDINQAGTDLRFEQKLDEQGAND